MQHDRQLSRLAVQSAKRMEERRIVLLRALWARHDPDGKESSDGRR